jgi:hypothetical protein
MSGLNIVGPGGIIEGTTNDVNVNVNLDAALDFDGSNDIVDLNYGSGVNAQAGFSVAFWAKLDDSFTGTNQMFIGSSTGTNQRFYIGNDGYRWSFGYASSGWSEAGSQTAFAGKWHHVCVTATSGAQKLYVNGVEITAQAKTDSSTFTLNSDLGAGAMFGGAYYSNGTMTDIKIFGDVLTAAEVQELASKPNYDITAGSIDNLTRWFKTNAGSGTTIADDSGNSGTAADITGATWVYDQFYVDLQNESTGGSGTFTVTRGKVQGLALTSYDFSSSALNVAYDTHGFASGNNFATQAITMACWIRPEASSAMGIMGFAGLNGSGGKSIALGIDVDRNDALSMALTFMDNDSTYGNPQNVGINASSLLDQNKWYHLAVTYNGSGVTTLSNFNFYINGQLVETGKATGTTTIYNHSPSFMGNSVVVGKCGADPVNGKVRDVRTYDSVLSAKEIASICANTNVASPNELWYKFDATSGVTDESTADLGAANTNFLPAANYVNGTLDLDSPTTDQLRISANGTLSAPRGNLAIGGAISATVNSFENYGTFIHNNGTVTFDATADYGQRIQETASAATAFYNLTHNRSASSYHLYIKGDITVENILLNQVGFVNLYGPNTLTMGTTSSAGAITMTSSGIRFYNNDSSNYAKIYGASSIYPFVYTGNEPDIDTYSSNASHVAFKNGDIQVAMTGDYQGGIVRLDGDMEFDAVTVNSGDTLNLNGQRAEFSGLLSSTGTIACGTNALVIADSVDTTSSTSGNMNLIETGTGHKHKFTSSTITNWMLNGGTIQNSAHSHMADNIIVATGKFDVDHNIASGTPIVNITTVAGAELDGNTFTLPLSGDWTSTGGLIGKSALTLDGTSDYMRAGTYDTANNFTGWSNNNLTVEVWAKSSDSSQAGIMTSFWGGAGTGRHFILYREANGSVRAAVNSDGGSTYVSTNGAEAGVSRDWKNAGDGKWHNYAMTYDGANLKLYIDGQLYANRATAVTLASGDEGIFTIGAYNTSSSDTHSASAGYIGDIGRVSVWNHTLTDSEIRTMMFYDYATMDADSDFNTPQGDLKGWYQFDEGTGTSIDNLTAVTNVDGLLVNGAWAGAGTFIEGTSTVDMTGNGKTMYLNGDTEFYNLNVAASGKTTNIYNELNVASALYIVSGGTLTHGGGTFQVSGGSSGYYPNVVCQGTYSAGADFENLYTFYFVGQSVSNVQPAGTFNYLIYDNSYNGGTNYNVSLGGNITGSNYISIQDSCGLNTRSSGVDYNIDTSRMILKNSSSLTLNSSTLKLTNTTGLDISTTTNTFSAGPGCLISGTSAGTTFKSQNDWTVVGNVTNLNVTNEELKVTGLVTDCTGDIHQYFPTIDHDQQIDADTADDRDIQLHGDKLDRNTELINS